MQDEYAVLETWEEMFKTVCIRTLLHMCKSWGGLEKGKILYIRGFFCFAFTTMCVLKSLKQIFQISLGKVMGMKTYWVSRFSCSFLLRSQPLNYAGHV